MRIVCVGARRRMPCKMKVLYRKLFMPPANADGVSRLASDLSSALKLQ